MQAKKPLRNQGFLLCLGSVGIEKERNLISHSLQAD